MPNFSTSPKAGPNIPTPPGTSARDRAIQQLMKSPEAPIAAQAQQHPVSNPNQVSPEELTAIRPSSSKEDESLEGKGQSPITEGAEAAPEAEKEAPKPPKEEQPLSAQYAQLARKEKAIRAKVQEIKAQEAALKAREEALNKAPAPAFDESKFISKDKLAQDPLTTLLQAGVSYDQLTQLMLNQPQQMDPATKVLIEEMRSEIQALKGDQENTKKSFQEQQSNAYKQAVDQIRNEVKSLVVTDPAFETIRETGSVNDVVDLIEKTFKAEGILLSVEDAAQAVEEYLVEEATRLARLKKIQDRLQPPKPAPKPQAAEPAKQPQSMKTLTNSVGTSRQLTAKERAVLAFKNELK